MTLDLDRIRHDANEAAKFVRDSLGTRVLAQDVPALIAEIHRLRGSRPPCTCPDVDISSLGQPPGTETARGLDPDCPQHGGRDA